MNGEKLKVIVLTHGGAGRFLELLAAVETVEVAGVFLETEIDRRRSSVEKLKRSIRYDGYASTIMKLGGRLLGRDGDGQAESRTVETNQNEVVKIAEGSGIPLVKVQDFHAEDSKRALRKANADLGILYGTNIVKQTVFGIPRLGSINIHQGLAPLYRGGPAVFWELFNGERDVGITVHFVAAKVDTGDIILQRSVPLDYDFARYGLKYEDFLDDFRASLTEPSAQLLVEAVRQIADGAEQRTKQDTTIGKRYKLPTKSEKDELLRVLIKRRKA